MFWFTILAATIFGYARVQSSSSNYTELIILDDGGNWLPFRFGQVGQPPFLNVRFVIGLMNGMNNVESVNRDGDGHHGMKKCYLEVTDAFCPGDRFEVTELGQDGLAPIVILTTPEVPYNPQVAHDICDGFPVQCSKSTSDPDVAFNDPTWSSGRVFMGPGKHSVVIKSIKSPYCSGAGFVRVRCNGHPMPPPPPPPRPPHPPHPELICKYSEGGFRMVMKPVQGPMAGSVCQNLGMKLAEIDNSNFTPSTNVAFKCSGPLSTSWIGAWNGQTWAGQEGLGLTVSTSSPGGSINVYNDGKARNVLCQDL